MGKSCCAIGCKNRFAKNSKISFYRLPKNTERRNKWIAAIRRKNWNPVAETWICSSHFVSGSKNDNPLHPDYVPSIFSFTSKSGRRRAVNYMSRYERSLAATALLDMQKSFASKAEMDKNNCVSTAEEQIVEVPGTEVQTEMTQSDVTALHEQIKSLNAECFSLRDQVHKLEHELKRRTLDPSEFDDGKMKYFTGLPNLQTFMLVFNLISAEFPKTAKQQLTATQELLLTLMKLRFNLSEEFLGHIFLIHQSTVSRMFRRWINVMASRLHPFILPGRVDLAPDPTPDPACLTEDSGLLDKLLPEDLVLADQDDGVDSNDTVGLLSAELETPLEHTQEKKQLSCKKNDSAGEISRVKRTRVEKVIGMLKQKYTILSSTLPEHLTRVLQNERVEDNLIDKIVLTCCALCNLCENKVPSD
ncbi:uncharacterized protein [Misgurnus anguillicaudatus]|uniref:uncharacterized protein n=1 Tax=Misgurnus anguillicaudatus TaxID=75329 RepID=UPI003CCF3AEF